MVQRLEMEDVPCEVIDRSFDKWRDVTEWDDTLWNFCSICDYISEILKVEVYLWVRRCSFCVLAETGFCASTIRESRLHPGYHEEGDSFGDDVEYLEPTLKKWRKSVEEFLDFLWPYTSYSEKDKR